MSNYTVEAYIEGLQDQITALEDHVTYMQKVSTEQVLKIRDLEAQLKVEAEKSHADATPGYVSFPWR